MRGAALCGLLAVGCLDPGISEAGPWLPWDSEPGAELAASPVPATPTDRLRIVTYNVHYGADVDGLAAAFRGDADLRAFDVLLVQEIEDHPEEGSSRASRLAAALAVGYVYVPARLVDEGDQGLAILSRLPLENVRVKVLPYVDLPVNDYRRIAVAADVELPSGPLRLVNIHLDTRLNIDDRLVQLRPAVIDAPEAVVAGGDLNTIPYLWAGGGVPLTPLAATAPTDPAAIVDDFMRALGFATPTVVLGTTQQSSELLQKLRLDHLYARGVDAVPGAVERGIGLSDHWPVWIDVTLRAQ
jgi:endonuclease/exonuclease/phosphatase family metal-dependent hydrolase